MKINLVISIISIIISLSSAIIAILSFASNRAKLIFFGKDDIVPLPTIPGEISATFMDSKQKRQSIIFPEGILYHIQVFNPSPQDIAYFDMTFIVDGEMPRNVWTIKTLGWATDNPKIIMSDPIKGTGEINIPSAPYGVFKAHSYTPLYLFVTTEDSPFPDNLRFKFKYAVRKFPYFGENNRYQEFSRDLDISNVQLEMQSKKQVMKQLTKSEPQQAKSFKTPPYSKKKRNKRK